MSPIQAVQRKLPSLLPVLSHWPKGAPFPVRKPELKFEDTKPHWFANNAVLTRHMDALSALFPDGERFFVQSVRAFQSQITDEALKKEIRAFIGQEARHSEQHTHYNAGVGDSVEWARQRCERTVAFAEKVLPPKLQLAVTVAAEHFTATWAKHLLSSPDVHETFLDDDLQRMWLWHAIEENEHKMTAFAVYKAVGGSETLRIAAMVPLAAILIGYLLIPPHLEILRRDGELFNAKAWRQAIQVMLGRNGFYTRTLPDFLDWFKPGFQPDDHDTDALLEQWRSRLGINEGSGEGNEAQPMH